MSSARSLCSRWPPTPCVEDELDSLARELQGLCHLGDNPGIEGTQARGAVDQLPVIMSVDSPTPSTTPSSVPGMSVLGNISSDTSAGPLTPTANTHDPVLHTSAGSLLDTSSRLDLVASPNSSRASRSSRPQVHQQPRYDLHSRADSGPPSRSREGSLSRRWAPVQVTSHSSPSMGGSDRIRSRGPMHKTYVYPANSSLGRSNSARHDLSCRRVTTTRYRSESNPGYQSDSVASVYRPPLPRSQPVIHGTVPRQPPTPPKLSERIEDRLKQRQERRYTVSVSDTEARKRAAETRSLNAALCPQIPATAPLSPSNEPRRIPSYRSHRERLSAPASRTASVPPTSQVRSRSDVPASTSMQRSISGSSYMSGPLPPNESRPPTRQRVPETPQTSTRMGRSQSQTSPSGHQTTSQPYNTAGLCLTPCPRFNAVSGQQDWYTLKGVPHLDICPSCMSQIAHSRFRNFFIPSLPKPVAQKTHCAFSNPWIRLAWVQMIKKQHDSLEMLYQMTRPPPGMQSCPGHTINNQTWHRIIDPETGLYLPRFHICGACARNVRILMPAHRDTFPSSPAPQGAVCDLVTTSPRFVQYIDLLDAAASRSETLHSPHLPDLCEFLSYARRKVVLRDCPRDIPTLSSWHYIPSLPELSACEDCYDEVIWPLVKSHRRIARFFTPTLHTLPGDNTAGACCQLYSPRMRACFRDAVDSDDFALLEALARRRVEAERRFWDRMHELMDAQAKGYDCHGEMRKAVDEWRRWE